MKGNAIGRVLDDVVEVDPDRAALIIAGVTTSFGQLGLCHQPGGGGTAGCRRLARAGGYRWSTTPACSPSPR